MTYASFKKSVLNKHIGDSECVSLIVNNPAAYSEKLFPGVAWTSIFKPVSGARELFNAVSTKYYTKIANDHANASQLPKQGDVMIFDATPHSGYTNTFNNPYGHTGICDKANSSGYWLLQQNAPASGQAVNVTYYPWNFRPCIGWLRPKLTNQGEEMTSAEKKVYEVGLKANKDQWKEQLLAYHTALKNQAITVAKAAPDFKAELQAELNKIK